MGVIVERGEYKGNPTITLKRKPDDTYPFSFGVGKARLVLEAIAEIGQFVEEEDAKAEAKKAAEQQEGGA